MATNASISASLDATTFAMVNSLAKPKGIAPEVFAAEAIRRMADSEVNFHAFVQVGIDAADRGELVSHEQVMAKGDAMIAKHRGKCS